MAIELPFDPIAEARRQWEQAWGPSAVAEMAAVTSIMRATQILNTRLNEALEPWGLTFPRYEALMLLFYSSNGSLPLGKMGDRLQVHRASVTNVIDRLEGQGLVTRTPHESDRRTILAEITPDGSRVAEEATKRLNELHFGTEPMSGADCDKTFELLSVLRRGAGDYTGEGPDSRQS